MSRPFSYDTGVFLYARGREHPLRAACRLLLEHVRTARVRGYASVEAVQEYAHVLLRRGHPPSAVTAAARDVASLCALQPFDGQALHAALDLIDRVPGLGMRDAVHAATALVLPEPAIITADRIFDDVPGLRRVVRLMPLPTSRGDPGIVQRPRRLRRPRRGGARTGGRAGAHGCASRRHDSS